MTLNQIKRELELIAQNHKQINTFGYGDIWEIATSGTINYPLMWVKLENSSIANKTQTVSFKVILMDLVANGEVNEDEVLSDQLEIAKDIVAQLQHPNYTWSFDADGVSIEPFTQRFNDSVSGWVIDVALDLPYTFDRCAMPYEGNTNSNSACPSVTIFDSNGNVLTTVSAGGSYTVTGGGTCEIDITFDNIYVDTATTSPFNLDCSTPLDVVVVSGNTTYNGTYIPNGTINGYTAYVEKNDNTKTITNVGQWQVESLGFGRINQNSPTGQQYPYDATWSGITVTQGTIEDYCGGGTCADATVENSDASYSNTVASGGTLVLPDTTYNIYVNGVLNQTVDLITLKNETLNINA